MFSLSLSLSLSAPNTITEFALKFSEMFNLEHQYEQQRTYTIWMCFERRERFITCICTLQIIHEPIENGVVSPIMLHYN